MVDRRIPIRPRFNDGGELVKVLFREDLYEKLQPILKGANAGGDIIRLGGLPILETIQDMLSELVIETWMYGAVIGFSVYHAIKLAVRGAISIGAFVYRSSGFSYDGARYDNANYAGGSSIVEVTPE